VTDPRELVGRLAGDERVQLIGVRHHSPVLAAAVPAMLDAFAPETLLVELPAEMQPWVRWLADPETVTPVALAAGSTAFYPFADFSPELVALRWARRRGVPVVCCDLPLADRSPRESPVAGHGFGPSLGAAVHRSLTGRAGDDLWDRWIEAGAPGSSPEAVRRAALAAGWALRHDVERHGVDPVDLRREACMRGHLRGTTGRVSVVVGAFHAPVLLDGPVLDDSADRPAPVISLVPYTFDLLDARSGYPAGIRDPRWQQAVLDSGGDPERIRHATHTFAVEVTRQLRAQGRPAGPGEAAEVVRLAGDLATLRSLPAPGRGELVEALQTVLAQGAPTGIGRGVARAMDAVLIGRRRGRLPAGAPRTGLLPAVEDELGRLRLPGPGQAARRIRLDPLRSPTDRERDLAIRRLGACGAAYGDPGTTGPALGGEALTTVWRVEWTPSTDAALGVAGLHGVTLAQAAEGLMAMRRRREIDDGGPTAEQALTGLEVAAACGLAGLIGLRLGDVREAVCHGGGVTQIVTGLNLLDRVRRGHVTGLTMPPDGIAEVRDDLHAAAVGAVVGLTGSTRVEDARALHDLVQAADEAGRLMRLDHAVRGLARDGTPLMSGAAVAVGVLLGHSAPEEFGRRLASWADLPAAEATDRLRGALSVAGTLLQSGGPVLEPLLDVVDRLSDDDFVRRLPALRGGFDALSPADRDRLLHTVGERHGAVQERLAADPATVAAWLTADRAGLAAVRALGLMEPAAAVEPAPSAAARMVVPGAISPGQRWRLLLGRETDRLPADQRRLATALDEIYGAGRGEGAYPIDGGGAGREPAYPQARDWLEDLESLFGTEVRDEVLARAAERGRLDAVLAADPQQVRPSVDLLHAVLSLAGGLPESRLARLRPLVARLTAELTAQLARRIRPALTGLGTPRPTRRPTGRLDLGATVRRNLHTVRPGPNGRPQVLPQQPVFRSPGRRSVDWQVVLLVDVSGSMEQSTVWAALTASILAGVPALRTHFVTFSTEVIDLTDRVTDPLSLLLEIRVGGGTHIAAGLRYARQITVVPQRTMVIVISDFEEGYAVGDLLAAVRALADDGTTLLGCASLDDKGRPRYSTGIAAQLVGAGMPVAALSPTELARWIGEQVR
jgi:Mg-chelatase subunit ChlD